MTESNQKGTVDTAVKAVVYEPKKPDTDEDQVYLQKCTSAVVTKKRIAVPETLDAAMDRTLIVSSEAEGCVDHRSRFWKQCLISRPVSKISNYMVIAQYRGSLEISLSPETH